MSTLQSETTPTRRTQPRREARPLRRSVEGVIAACVLSLLQVSARRREGPFGVDHDVDW